MQTLPDLHAQQVSRRPTYVSSFYMHAATAVQDKACSIEICPQVLVMCNCLMAAVHGY